MTTGDTLLELQDIDLALMRNKNTLDTMPGVRELAKKRAQYRALRAEAQKILGARKDIEIEIADLEARRTRTEDLVTETQAGAQNLTDYRAVQDFETRLSDLGKELDKIDFALAKKRPELEEAQKQERKVLAYMKKFESAFKAETAQVREHAGDLLSERERLEKRRADLAGALPADIVERYDRAREQFKGLAVEKLVGNHPTVCRIALQPSSMGDLKHAGTITECPYCHRMLVLESGLDSEE